MSRAVRLTLATVALAAGLLSAVAGNPQPSLRDDEVSAVDLAAWLRDGRAGLLVLDMRDDAAAERGSVAGSRRPAEIAGDAPKAGLVVVYADAAIDDGAFAALCRRYPGSPLRRLRGGLQAWNDDVLFPTIRADAPARTQRAFATRAELSRYFGGTPRRIAPGEAPTHHRSRRGC